MLSVEKAPDLRRRFFCFGAAATLIVPPPKSFFILSPPKLVLEPPIQPPLLFDLPMQQMLELIHKLETQELELGQIPRWVVVDKQWYDTVVASGD